MIYLAAVLLLVTHLIAFLVGHHRGYWRAVNEKPELPPLTEEERAYGFVEPTYHGPHDREHADFVRPGSNQDLSS